MKHSKNKALLADGHSETHKNNLFSAHQASAAADLQNSLTKRELEIIELIAEGLRNKEIAVCLGISIRTVEYHITNILDKFEVKSRLEAVLNYQEIKLGRN